MSSPHALTVIPERAQRVSGTQGPLQQRAPVSILPLPACGERVGVRGSHSRARLHSDWRASGFPTFECPDHPAINERRSIERWILGEPRSRLCAA